VTDVVDSGLRVTALSTSTAVQNLLGLAVGPVRTGVLADRFGLPTALAVMPAACGAAAPYVLVRPPQLCSGPRRRALWRMTSSTEGP